MGDKMNYLVGSLYHGFTLLWSKEVKEIKSVAHYFEHKRTGAKLMYLENEDEERVFSVTFKTPPEDDCGTAHILEHSVLQGSRKYPVKTVLWELLNGTMNTFLNAGTSSDHTSYYFATTNQQDLWNIMGVFLDAVFFPIALENENIFLQEGWRYELSANKNELQLNGIVYNEMKANFAKPWSVLRYKSNYSLNPDNCYRFVSGGDPQFIPDLSYNKFKEFHKKNYHPTNCNIWLYGDINLDNTLEIINNNYLSKFEKSDDIPEFSLQKPLGINRVYEDTYPIGENELDSKKTFISFNYQICNIDDLGINAQMGLLVRILIGREGAVLKQAILDSGLAQNISGDFSNDQLQSNLRIIVEGTESGNRDRIEELVLKTLKEICLTGIPKEQIEAELNVMEIAMKEPETHGMPKGIYYLEQAQCGLLYDINPLLYLEYENSLKEMRKSINEPVLENLIQNKLINSNHKSIVTLSPEKGKQARREQELKGKLLQIRKDMTDEQYNCLKNKLIDFKKWQNTKPTDEQLASIPYLELTSLNKTAHETDYDINEETDWKFLNLDKNTDGIEYVNLFFDANHLEHDELFWAGTVKYLLTRINTKNYSYSKLSEKINTYTGGIQLFTSSYRNIDDLSYSNYIGLSTKCLEKHIEKLPELFQEITINTIFDDKERIMQYLSQLKQIYNNFIISNSLAIIRNRASSKLSQGSSFIDAIYYLGFYNNLGIFISEFESNFESAKNKLEKVFHKMFQKGKLITAVCGSKSANLRFRTGATSYIDRLNSKKKFESYQYCSNPVHEALIVPINNNFNCISTMLPDNTSYNGNMEILSKAVTSDFISAEIRIKGGAYGGQFGISNDNSVSFISWSDPNISNTYQIFENVTDYIRNINITDEKMRQLKIGAIATFDKPETDNELLSHCVSDYIRNISQEHKQRIRDDIFATTVEDLRKLADPLEKAIKKGVRCTMGNAQKIEENRHLFDEIIKVVE